MLCRDKLYDLLYFCKLELRIEFLFNRLSYFFLTLASEYVVIFLNSTKYMYSCFYSLVLESETVKPYVPKRNVYVKASPV